MLVAGRRPERGRGTAPTAESSAKPAPPSVVALGPEGAQRLETRVDVVVGMVVRPLVERQAADRTEAGAVGAVQRGDRLGQRDRVADRGLQVELVMVGQAQRVRLVVGRDGRAGRQVERRAGTPRRGGSRSA